MSIPRNQLIEIFELKLKDPSSWKKLEAYAASYMRDRIRAGGTYGPEERASDECLRLLKNVLPYDDHPSYHTLFELYSGVSRFDELRASQVKT